VSALKYALLSLLLAGSTIQVADADPLLADFDYPHPVQRYEFQSQGQSLAMAYMDVRPVQPNGRSVVLLHGKNFCGATWEDTIGPLRDAGYRIVVPDQIGFCKSTKPQAYQFGLHQLAANTHALLASIGVARPIVLGHSMGGMLALRYALMHPRDMTALVVVNPIGRTGRPRAYPLPPSTSSTSESSRPRSTASRSISKRPTMAASGNLNTTAG
jgi:pimeloyl-ACP methyl ester carboxylesterase